jgi:hypothetical protein
MPLWIKTEIMYSDADRTILDELRKCSNSTSRKLTLPTGIDPLKSAVDGIIDNMKVIQDYVNVCTPR